MPYNQSMTWHITKVLTVVYDLKPNNQSINDI